ncbi:MAG TPA: hypothetical protein VK849_07765 [Longimicrobiales bacterium]|nr:hypothetical protein [Longimicrobiales bacterium]
MIRMRLAGARHVVLAFGLMATSGRPLAGQVAEDIRREYDRRVYAAEQDSASVPDLVGAAEAARYMRKFDESRLYLRVAALSADAPSDRNAILSERLWLALATGGGVEEVQRIFGEARVERVFTPIEVAGWASAFPELLVGGGLDGTIIALAADAERTEYRCACLPTKAWMYRVRGELERSRAYWDSAVSEPLPDRAWPNPYDEADRRALRARNLARAGRADEARVELDRAMGVDLSAFESVSIRRRRAQTYAELGEVERAVEDLQYLLSVPSPVTVHTLESRQAWALIRDHPAFQAMLWLHKGG